MNKVLIIIVALSLSACVTARQERAATTGAAIGGIAGTILGAESNRPVEGAIMGAFVGAVAGAIIAAPSGSEYYGQHHHGNGYWHHHHGDGNYNHHHQGGYYRGHVYHEPEKHKAEKSHRQVWSKPAPHREATHQTTARYQKREVYRESSRSDERERSDEHD